MKDTTGDLSDGRAPGIDNLLYSADAEFSCFADMALVSPGEYYKEGEGSLIQAVSTVTLEAFMASFNTIVQQAAATDKAFYDARGVVVHSLEVVRYEPKDA